MTKKNYIFLLIIIGFIVFLNSLFNSFVWDDEEQVLNNILIHSFSNFFQFFSTSTFNTGGTGSLGGLYYKPLMTTFFSLIYTIFGPNPFFFHLFQVSLHIANSIFIFLVFRHLFNIPKKDLLSFVLALIFLIHPINAEAVVYVSDLQDILFFFFGIMAFWRLITFKLANLKECLILSILLLCSLLSKETGILFYFVTGIYVLLFLRQRLVSFIISAASSIGVYSVLRFLIAGIFFNKHGLSPITTMTFFERLMSTPKLTFFYFKTFIFPKDLAINQHWVVNSLNQNDFYFPLITSLLVFVLLILPAIYFFIKNNHFFMLYIFFLLWFIAGLGMHLHIIFPLDLTVSDRWFYFPMVGLLGMFGVLIEQMNYSAVNCGVSLRESSYRTIHPRSGAARYSGSIIKISHLLLKKILILFLIIIIISLALRTIFRNSDWKDGLTLYSHDINISKNAFDLENNLGVELFRVGRFDEATVHFENSTKLAPYWWTNWNNLGAMLERKNDLDGAKKYYQKAVDNGQYYLAYENLAKIYLKTESPEKTVAFVETSLKILPNNSSLWFVLAVSEYRLGNKDRALVASKNAYLLNQNEQNLYIYSRLSQNLPLDFP